MAATPKRRRGKTAKRSRPASNAGTTGRAAASSAERAMGDTMDRAVEQGQQVLRGWTAAYGAALRGWSDLLRASAETATRAAQAFDDEMK
jgi:hypothetical protein